MRRGEGNEKRIREKRGREKMDESGGERGREEGGGVKK